ncbi:unnamed protein product [Hermetia illucens]|uniref:Nucleolar protein 4 n=1 Tax=Hermetia illucens TaxID=343691 RepID=A0A7R8YUI9_HERIL|nr:unnamed protein product [Hermetia illucens]
MGERLRGRDARNNSNKCYAAFFEEGDDDPHHNSAKTAKMKISRSPPKKRESPKKRSKRAALTTVQNSLELGVAVHVPVDGGSDVLTKQPVETSSAFVANVTPSYSPKECDQRTTKMGEGQCVEVCVEGKKEVDEGVEVEVRELNGEENKTEHVVVSDDDEEDMKSESLKSNNNNKRKFSASSELNSLQLVEHLEEANGGDEDIKKLKLNSVKDQMFEIFQPWALKTYGDQAKTKTITRRKKNRILKALDGKEQNNPDSSKFRFWVKSKGFTVQRPQNFFGYSSPGEVTSEKGAAIYKLATAVGALQGQASTVQEMDTQKDHIDLYVASTVKASIFRTRSGEKKFIVPDFGERVYRKVAVVEEFFEIIYNVHVERGGRNGRHAGQKRTYRIITETYAFLPREAVTKFLTSCPTCKKNLRPFSPSRFDDTFTESSSEYEALNYSSQNESSVDSLQLGPIRSVRRKAEGKASPLVTNSYSECVDMATPETKCDRKRYNEAVFNFDKNSSKIEEPTKFDDKFKLGQDFLSSEKFSFLERPKVGEGYPFSERFNMNNLLRPEFLHKGMIGLHGLFMRNEQLNIDSKFHANEKWNQMHYPLSPNYYQYFGKPPRTPCNSPVGHRERICDKIPAGTPNNENLDSSIDLTINQASSININIGSSPDAKSQSSGSTKKLKLDHADEVCFNTVDVSINMLNSSNELKISCKTTPPKKRYNAFRDKESNPLSTLSATYSNTTTGDSVIGDENCAMNLSKTFRSELSEMKPAAMKMAPTGSTVTAEPFQVDLSKVKPITSTYLRMTRSFGLSDEDALRIDDLVSKDFKYTL